MRRSAPLHARAPRIVATAHVGHAAGGRCAERARAVPHNAMASNAARTAAAACAAIARPERSAKPVCASRSARRAAQARRAARTAARARAAAAAMTRPAPPRANVLRVRTARARTPAIWRFMRDPAFAIRDAATDCNLANLGNPEDAVLCLGEGTGLSEACATCYAAGWVGCLFDECLAACAISGLEGQECIECAGTADCDAVLWDCTGIDDPW